MTATNEKTKVIETTEEPVAISVKALYDMYGPNLTLGTIKKHKSNGETYYDLYNEDGELACCDGEEWPMEENGGYLVTFLTDGPDGSAVRFTLTQEELGVATFR